MSISHACTGHHLWQGWAARLAGALRPSDDGVRNRRQVPHYRLVLAARLLDPLPLADPLLGLQQTASDDFPLDILTYDSTLCTAASRKPRQL